MYMPQNDLGTTLERMSRVSERRLSASLALASRQERVRLAELQTLTEAFGRVLTRHEVGRAVLALGLPTVGAGSGMVHLLSMDGTSLERVATLGSCLEDVNPCRLLLAEEERSGGGAVVRGTPLWLESPEESRACYPELASRLPQQAVALLPLLVEGRWVGVLTLGFGPARRFSEAQRALMGDLARQCAHALERTRLQESERAARLLVEAEARRHAARLRMLAETDRLLAEAGLDLPAVLEVIVRQVSEALGEGCVLQLRHEEDAAPGYMAAHHPVPEARWLLAATVHARRQKAAQGLHGGVVDTARVVQLPDVDVEWARASGALPEFLPYLERYGAQSLMGMPLAARGRVVGSLWVLRDAEKGAWPEEDRLLLQGLAERAALAIEDARLYGEATEAVRLRDDFLSVAGHELKTPLSALRLQLQLIMRQMRAEAPEMTQRLAKAERSAERLTALVDELLDAGRITSGRLKLEREELELGGLVRDTVGRMSESLARAGNEVRVVVEAPVPGRWDRVRLEQVVSNLLSNAARYGAGKPVEVRVETGPEGRACLSVKDEGIGIAPADQPRIFERFERAVTDAHCHGLGLGLWITREIVESHGGQIGVRSAPGQGSTFTVELPRE